MPTAPQTPTWITSNETSITIKWSAPTDDGGCPVREYRVYRDDGLNGSVITSVQTSELIGIHYARELVVTDLPLSSIGNRFRFRVVVFTDLAIAGVSSNISASFILADRPDQPSAAPTRNVLTDESTVAVNIIIVPGFNGAPIISYNIEIDDGLGGAFREL
jgi:Fibronectin type III domain